MCGIAGALNLGGRVGPIRSEHLIAMRDVMASRGPDAAGLWRAEDGSVGLAHRRLSIIDLSAAAEQPMANEDGSLRLVFNGEIYNHAEIRAELERTARHHWRTDHSDTEVILHAYEEWGIECIQRFRGMFAFALWDGREQALWLVRDRLGIKPVYYTLRDGRLTFASEVKALLTDPSQPRAVNRQALYDYLSFLTTPGPDTLFQGIRKLPPATRLRIDRAGRIHEERYWDPWDHTTPLTGVSEEEVAERVLEALQEAVELRKVSDVPVGVFLSGGLDSSTNAALFSDGGRLPISTFSIGYEGEHSSYTNELHWARRMAKEIGASHHERLLTQDDLLRFLPTMVRLQDEPIADPVCVPVYYVSELARQKGVPVCQVGEGADELFWGYPHWKIQLRLQQADALPVPRALKRLGLAALRGAGQEGAIYYEWLRRAVAGQPVFWGGAESFTEGEKRRLLAAPLRTHFRDYTSWEAIRPVHQRFMERAWDTHPLHWMTYLDLNLRLPELLLMRVDKMSMGVSLEARVPFLDHKLVELALSIPPGMKTRGGRLKHILKRAVQGVVPDEIINRKKQGFGVPVHDWIFDRLGVVARRELTDFVARAELLDEAAVDSLFRRRQHKQIWFLLNLAMWWREYIAGEPVELAPPARVAV